MTAEITSRAVAETRKLIEQLQRERDELRVRAHLLGRELSDEWQRIEHQWDQIDLRLERLGAGARESAGDVGAALAQLGEEIATAYRRMRAALR
ncbi:MAG: hypothetical protein ACO3P1_03890 [Pseudomonadales bacterium]|jgi:hypothetical protein